MNLIFTISSCEIKTDFRKSETEVQYDSVEFLIKQSEESKISKEDRSLNLSKAYNKVSKLDNDSIKIKYLVDISLGFYDLGDYVNFNKINHEFLDMAIHEKDTLRIADFYWNKAIYLTKLEILDSAYYNYLKANTLFERAGHKYYTAKMQYNMAFILRRTKSFIASENYALRAISNIKLLDKKLLLYRCYNHLGLLYNDLDDYELSISYHKKAMDLLPFIEKNGILLERSLNNLSLVYQKQGKYDLAIATLNKALEDPELPDTNYNLYTKLIDNRAYCRFLKGDTLQVLHDFNRALAMRQEMENEAGIAISKLHLSEYFLKTKDSASATAAASEAYEISSRLHFNRDILVSLHLLADSDPKHASTYMNQYVTLNDSLLQEERKIRDKFTRIQFETEGYISANKELQQKNVWISLSSILALASLAFLFLNYRQRSRNRTLLLEKQQQNANEEIYNLMLKQQSKTEEGRIQERVRISEELHDGVLAKLFSVRIGMGFLALKGEEKDERQYQAFMDELQAVEKEIRMLSHELKNDELSSKKDFPILLKELLEEQGKLGGFAHQLEQDPSIAWDRVSDKIKINLYRMAQEAIHNVMKYAGCSEVVIHLEKNEDAFDMRITDNGQGFDVNQKRKGIGLKNMKSRVESIGAGLRINSIPGKGTTIKITIPTKILYHEPNE